MAYVYEHWRPDTNKCFYVGKGTGKRAYLFWRKDRSQHYLRVVDKLRRSELQVEVRIVTDNLSDEEALIQEQKRIAIYGLENLTNQTADGDGLRNPTAETRKKMVVARRRVLSDPEFKSRHAEGMKRALERDPLKYKRAAARRAPRSAESIAKAAAALRGRKRPDLSVRMSGEDNPFFGKTHSPETLALIAAKKRGSKMSVETREKMRIAQRARRAAEAALKPPPAPKLTKTPFRHSAETIARMRIAAKKRGISAETRAAAKTALTGRKRAPFTAETIARMRIAAQAREAAKRSARSAK